MQLEPVFLANKSSFISDLCGWRTPCVSDRRFRSPESPATADGGIARGLPVPRGLNSQRGSGPAVERRRRSRPRSTGFHGSSPRKCQRLSTLRWVRLPPSRPPTQERGPRRRRPIQRQSHLTACLPGRSHISTSAPVRPGPIQNHAHICVTNQK